MSSLWCGIVGVFGSINSSNILFMYNASFSVNVTSISTEFFSQTGIIGSIYYVYNVSLYMCNIINTFVNGSYFSGIIGLTYYCNYTTIAQSLESNTTLSSTMTPLETYY